MTYNLPSAAKNGAGKTTHNRSACEATAQRYPRGVPSYFDLNRNTLPRLDHKFQQIIGSQHLFLRSSTHDNLIACPVSNHEYITPRNKQLFRGSPDQFGTGVIGELLSTQGG